MADKGREGYLICACRISVLIAVKPEVLLPHCLFLLRKEQFD